LKITFEKDYCLINYWNHYKQTVKIRMFYSL
jgi:hypothetical protein